MSGVHPALAYNGTRVLMTRRDWFWLKTPGANGTKFEAGRRDHASPTWRVGHESKAGFCRDRYRPGSRRHVDCHLDAEQRRRVRPVTAEGPGPDGSIRSV